MSATCDEFVDGCSNELPAIECLPSCSDDVKGSVLRYMPLFVLVLLASLTAGCAKARAYSGPKRPDSELSTVFFHASPAVSLSAMTLDGTRKALSAAGYSALPGRHTYRVNYNMARAVVSGTCSGEFTSEVGKEYIVDVVGVSDSASVSVFTDGRRVLVTSGDCR